MKCVVKSACEKRARGLLWHHPETVGTEFAKYFKSRSGEGYDALLRRIK
jgi:hypothetical protein